MQTINNLTVFNETFWKIHCTDFVMSKKWNNLYWFCAKQKQISGSEEKHSTS